MRKVGIWEGVFGIGDVFELQNLKNGSSIDNYDNIGSKQSLLCLLLKITCSLEKVHYHYTLAFGTNIRISRIFLYLYPHCALDELPALLNQEDASLEEDGTDDQDVDAVVWGMYM